MATALDNLLVQVGGKKTATASGTVSGGNLDSIYSQLVTGKYQTPSSPYTTQVDEPVSAPITKPNKVTEFVSKTQQLAQQVGNKVTSVSQKVSDKATPIVHKAIPQLDPSTKVKVPSAAPKPYDVPNKPAQPIKIKSNIFDFTPTETGGSAQLTPKAKADSQQKLEDFLKTPTGKAITKVGNVIDHFAEEVKRAAVEEPIEVQKQLNELPKGVLKPAGAIIEADPVTGKLTPVQEKRAREIMTEWVEGDSLQSILNRSVGLILVGNIQGLTGGIIKPDKVELKSIIVEDPNDPEKFKIEPKHIPEYLAYHLPRIMGQVVALRTIGKGIESVASGSTTIGEIVTKYPKWGKFAVQAGKNIAAFDIYGQLDPDLEDRLHRLAIDTVTAGLFSAIGTIKKGYVSIPVNFAMGTTLAKAQGASWEDAIMAGLLLATLDAASRGSKKLFEPTLKAKGGKLTMTPDEAVAQVAGSDLKGTPSGEQINQLAMQAKVQGKNLQIEMTVGKVSSVAQDVVGAQTPKGAKFTVTLVDPPAKVTAKPGKPAPKDAKQAIAAEQGAVKPTAESSGFAETVAKGKMKIKPGESLGDYQVRVQQAGAQPLLAEYDLAMQANDMQRAQTIAQKIVADPAYAAYKQTFMKRTGIDMLMKLKTAQESGNPAEITKVTDEIRSLGQPQSVTAEAVQPASAAPVVASAVVRQPSKPKTEEKAPEVTEETKPETTPEEKPKRRTIKATDLPEGVSAIATIRPDNTAGMSVHIEPTQQSKGYGTEAVKQLETKLISEGIKTVTINADLHNTDPGERSSVGFWEKMGYTKTGKPEGYFQPMSKDLEKELKNWDEESTVKYVTPDKTLYRGSNGVVTEEHKNWDAVLVVNVNQAELIKRLADNGDKEAQELYDASPNKKKVDFTIADKIIKNRFDGVYKAIQYNNNDPQLKAQGTTYFEISSGRSFAEKEETAKVYAANTRSGKYEKPKPEKKSKLVTDPTDRQRIEESMREGELILRTGKFNGIKKTPEELESVKRSVNSDREKLGQPPYDEVMEYAKNVKVRNVNETARDIQIAIDASFIKTYNTQPEWMTDISNFGSTRFYVLPGGVTAALQILEYDNMIVLKRMELSDKGTGAGTKIVNDLKNYADSTNQKLIIQSAEYNPNFWKKFDFLVKSKSGLTSTSVNLEYTPEKRPDVLIRLQSDIPYEVAKRAHDGTSFYPERRAKSEIEDYVNTLTSDYKELQKLATDQEKQATLDRMFSYLREGYKTRVIARLNADSKTLSVMITGGSNFPTSRNQKALNTSRQRSQEAADFREKMYKKIANELNPQTFKGTSEKTISQMDEKLANLKDTQIKMKAANKIIQSGDNVKPRLLEMGLTEKIADEIMKPDFMGRLGYPQYQLTSINNKIKTLEKRHAVTVAKREKANTTGNDEVKIGDVTVIKNYDENRLQLQFPGKPSDEMRSNLKSAGFRWSPYNKVWQRILTNDAIWRTKKLLGVNQLFKPAVAVEEPVAPEVVDINKAQRLIAKAYDKDLVNKDQYYLQNLIRDMRDMEALIIKNGGFTNAMLTKQGFAQTNLSEAINHVVEVRVKASQPEPVKSEGKELVIDTNTELYHGTSQEKAYSIEQDGLYPSVDTSANYGDGIYLTPDRATAVDYALDNFDADKKIPDGDVGVVMTFKPTRPLKLLTLTKEEREKLKEIPGEAQMDRIYDMLMQGGDTDYDGFNLPEIGLGDGSPQIVIYDKLGMVGEAEESTSMIAMSKPISEPVTEQESVKKPWEEEQSKPKPAEVPKQAPKKAALSKLPKPKQIMAALNKPKLPILENLLVRNGVLYATDLDTVIAIKTDQEDGLYKVVGDDLIRSSDNIEDYPELPNIEENKQFTVSGENFIPALKKVINAASKDQSRPILNKILMEYKNDQLIMTTTDGIKLHRTRIDVDLAPEHLKGTFLVPGLKLDKMIKLLGGDKIELHTTEDRQSYKFTGDNGDVIIRSYFGDSPGSGAGEYPPVDRVFGGFKNQIEVDKKSLLKAVKEIDPYTELNLAGKNTFTMDIGDKEISLKAVYMEAGENQTKVVTVPLVQKREVNIPEGIIDGTLVMPFRSYAVERPEGIGFDKRYFTDAVNAVDGDRVFFDYNDPKELKPVHFSNKLEQPDQIKTAPKAAKTARGGSSSSYKASKGNFTEDLPRIGTAPEEVKIETIKIIEFPEMLRIVRQITGKIPKIKKLPRSRGYFNPLMQQIVLNRDLFESEMQAARTFAHEIGHLTDFIGKVDNTMKRGNLLGRLATLTSYRKHFISDKPPAVDNLITPEDRERLRKEAVKLSKEPVEVTKEVMVGEVAVEPKEILAIWNNTKSSVTNPELLKYIQTLSSAEKVAIVKYALKGIIPEWMNFKKQILKTITVKEFRKAPEDIRKLYKKLLAEEVAKRHLISLELIRDELKAVSFAWRPLDPQGTSPSHMAYRNSGEELYADAISVLFNDPVRLEQDAPVFYRSFFNYLQNKPQANEAFFDAWHLLNQGEDAVLDQRLKSIDEMFANDEAKAKALKHERDSVRRDVMFEIKYQFLYKYQKIADQLKADRKKGKHINPDDNPQYALNEYNYMGSKIKSFLDREINPWYSKLAEKGVTWEDVGKLMMLDRIIGERKDIANPLGLSKSTAEPVRTKMLEEMGETKAAHLQEAVTNLRAANKKIMDEAYERGQLYPETLYKQMSENETYASFRVTDYLDKNITAKIYKQFGTLKDIGNPATATMGKMIATMRATERAATNRKIVDYLKTERPDEIELAKTRWNGKRQEPVEPTDGRGMIINMEEGKAVGYYVDPFVADMISYSGLTTTNIAIDAFKQANSSWFRPVFTSVNLGFMIWNTERDFLRIWKATPGFSLPTVAANYIRALPHATRRVLNIYDSDINELERIGALAPPFNELMAGMTDEDTQMSVLWDKYSGQGKGDRSLKNMILKLFVPIEKLGNFVETVPKVASYYTMSDKLDTVELANFIREKGGSPDFLAKGNATATTNPVFLFSNAMAQGTRADYDTMSNPKTRTGYWFKTFLLNILPKLLMKAAIMGIFGAHIKQLYDNISEYNKTNYNPIAWGMDENQKTVWTPGVSDQTGQLIGGTVWKLLNLTNNQSLEEGLQELFSHISGQMVPNLNPAISAGSTTLQYLQGQNPYDNYRNREIIPQAEFEAGGMYALVPFLKYQFQSMGGSIIFGGSVLEKSQTGDMSTLEKVINVPVASNILQRFIRVSNYGQQELNRQVANNIKQERAVIRIQDREMIDQAVIRVQSGEHQRSVEKELIHAIRGEGKVTPEVETRMNSARSQFRMAIIRGENDPNLNSLIYATSNQEKAAILKRVEIDMDPEQFDALKKEALVGKVISPEVIDMYRRM